MKIEYLIFGSYILSSYISKVIMRDMKNTKFNYHFYDRVMQRFDFGHDLDFIKNVVITNSKKYTYDNVHSCPHKTVRNKLYNPKYSQQEFYVNERYNIILVGNGDSIFNALYLDGRDGYGRNTTWN